MILDEALFEKSVASDRLQRIKKDFHDGITDLTRTPNGTTDDVSDLQFLSSNAILKNEFLKTLDEWAKKDFVNNYDMQKAIELAKSQLDPNTTSTSNNNQEAPTQQKYKPFSDAVIQELLEDLIKKFPYTYRIANGLQKSATDLTQNTYWMSAMQFYCFSARKSGTEPVTQMQVGFIIEDAHYSKIIKNIEGIKDTSLAQVLFAISERKLPLNAITNPAHSEDIYASSGMWNVGSATLIAILNLANVDDYAEKAGLYVDASLNGNTSNKLNKLSGDIRPLTYEDVKGNDNFAHATEIINNAKKLGESLNSTRSISTKREQPYDSGEFKDIARQIRNAPKNQVVQDVIDFLSTEPRTEVDKFVDNYANKYQ